MRKKKQKVIEKENDKIRVFEYILNKERFSKDTHTLNTRVWRLDKAYKKQKHTHSKQKNSEGC